MKLKKKIHFLLKDKERSALLIFIHPYLYAFFTKGFFSKRLNWLFKYKIWIILKQDSSLGITEFKFFNEKGQEIIL
jgi:ribonuclease G